MARLHFNYVNDLLKIIITNTYFNEITTPNFVPLLPDFDFL